jgi:plastocyanin
VAYTDPAKGSVFVATSSGSAWQVHPVEQNLTGVAGVSLATGARGSILVSYLTESDARVATATDPASAWTVAKSPEFTTPTTQGSGGRSSVAQAKGSTYLAYTDPDDGTIALAVAKGTGAFSPIDTPGTQNGQFPALAVADDGTVQLAWYDSVAEDLELGLYPEQQLVLAAPASQTPYAPPPNQGGGQTCPKDTVEIIAGVGAGGVGFQTPKVSAPSGDFQICFNNEDSSAPHDVQVFKSQADADSGATPLAQDDAFTGPKIDNITVKALASGSYFFHCSVHPGFMFGTLTVK